MVPQLEAKADVASSSRAKRMGATLQRGGLEPYAVARAGRPREWVRKATN